VQRSVGVRLDLQHLNVRLELQVAIGEAPDCAFDRLLRTSMQRECLFLERVFVAQTGAPP
jgi:hypothetical protein